MSLIMEMTDLKSWNYCLVMQKPCWMLDIGCAEGSFVASIKKRNKAEVWGIEYSEEVARKEKVDTLMVGDAMDLVKDLPDNYFQLITCNDVLEHLVDPYSTIEVLRSKLTSNGQIFASIPQIRYYKTIIKIFLKKRFQICGFWGNG